MIRGKKGGKEKQFDRRKEGRKDKGDERRKGGRERTVEVGRE